MPSHRDPSLTQAIMPTSRAIQAMRLVAGLVLVTGLMQSLVGCASSSAQPSNWASDAKVFGDKVEGKALADLEAKQRASQSVPTATVVVFRQGMRTKDQAPANVYIADRYQTSLLPGGYTSLQVCPGTHHLAALVNHASLAHQEGKRQGTAHQFAAGKTYYFEVEGDRPDNSVLRPSTDVALRVGGAQKQIHAISRAPVCEKQVASTQ